MHNRNSSPELHWPRPLRDGGWLVGGTARMWPRPVLDRGVGHPRACVQKHCHVLKSDLYSENFVVGPGGRVGAGGCATKAEQEVGWLGGFSRRAHDSSTGLMDHVVCERLQHNITDTYMPGLSAKGGGGIAKNPRSHFFFDKIDCQRLPSKRHRPANRQTAGYSPMGRRPSAKTTSTSLQISLLHVCANQIPEGCFGLKAISAAVARFAEHAQQKKKTAPGSPSQGLLKQGVL